MLINYSYYSSRETIRDDYSHALGGHGLTAANLALECGLTGPQDRRTIVRAALELAETDDFDRAVAMLADLAAILRRRDSDVAVTDAITAATAPDSRVAVELTRRLCALELDA